MSEDAFNMSIRKFLKEVGITSQRKIEDTVREGSHLLPVGKSTEAAPTFHGASAKPDWLFPQATAPEATSSDWRPMVPRLSVPWIQRCDGVQPNRRATADTTGENVDDGRKRDLAPDSRPRCGPRSQRSPVAARQRITSPR